MTPTSVRPTFPVSRAPPTMGTEYQRDFTIAFSYLATEHKLQYLPFLLEGVALKKELNQADGMHPNAAGVDVIVARMLPVVEELVTKAAAK